MYSYEVCSEPAVEDEESEVLAPNEICKGVFRTNYYWWNEFLEKYICPEIERRNNPNPDPVCNADQLDEETMTIATEAIAVQELIDQYIEEGFWYAEVYAFGGPFTGNREAYEATAALTCQGLDPVDTGYTTIEIDPACEDLLSIQEGHELANMELGLLLSE